MVAIFSTDLRIQNAANFKDVVDRQVGNTRIYFCFGKVDAWPNDAAPIQANSSIDSFNYLWKNMVGAKLLAGNEVRHVVPRFNWTSGNVYAAFDHCTCSLQLFDGNTQFYVVTSDWNVYKCLANNAVPVQNTSNLTANTGSGSIVTTLTLNDVAQNSNVFFSNNYTLGVGGANVRVISSIPASNSVVISPGIAGNLSAQTVFVNTYAPPSTVMPTQILTNKAVEETDGYIWKFMYNISASERVRFTTDSYMPVKTVVQNDNSLQWQVQANAVAGSVEAIKLTNVGSGYINTANIIVTITGDGTGANANARINTSTNTISNVVITAKGAGYTFANVTITDAGTGTNATARVIISPPGGHGSDALHELGGGYLILNPRLSGSENSKFPTTNQYRQVSLIVNPKLRGTTNTAANVAYSQFTTVYLQSKIGETFDQDEIVYQGLSQATASFSGRVLSYANDIVQLTDVTGSLTATDQLVGANTNSRRVVTSYLQSELQPYSGNMLYIDNILPVARASDQTEDFKVVMKF